MNYNVKIDPLPDFPDENSLVLNHQVWQARHQLSSAHRHRNQGREQASNVGRVTKFAAIVVGIVDDGGQASSRLIRRSLAREEVSSQTRYKLKTLALLLGGQGSLKTTANLGAKFSLMNAGFFVTPGF